MKIEKNSEFKYVISAEESKKCEFDAKLFLDAVNECGDGAEIIFDAGIYYFPGPDNIINLKNIKKNIAFKAEEGARLIGGRAISGAVPVSGEIRERFSPETREKVFCIDLKNMVIVGNGIDKAKKE